MPTSQFICSTDDGCLANFCFFIVLSSAIVNILSHLQVNSVPIFSAVSGIQSMHIFSYSMVVLKILHDSESSGGFIKLCISGTHLESF